MKNTFWFVCVVSVFIATACDKNDDQMPDSSPSSSQEIIDCHEQISWDSIKLISALEGRWEWQQVFNPWQNNTNTEAFEDAILNIQLDGTATFTHNGEEKEGMWRVEYFADRSFCSATLQVNIPEIETGGCLYLCDDEFIVYNSPVDGLDVWYRKL